MPSAVGASNGAVAGRSPVPMASDVAMAEGPLSSPPPPSPSPLPSTPLGAGPPPGSVGVAPASAPPAAVADRLARKRSLQEELSQIRSQKAEVLRRIGELAKRRRASGGGAAAPPPALAAAAAPEARRAALAEDQRRRRESLWQACSKAVAALLGNGNTRRYFGAPVDVHYAPTYYDVIKRPMDLGTVKRKLERREYADPAAFRDDVRLVFDNCRTFNPVGNPVRQLGDAASDKFERRWAAAAVEAAWDLEARKAALETQALEAELRTLPEQLREAAGELAELAAKGAPGDAAALAPPPPDSTAAPRPMTFDEKRRLSQAIAALPGERLDGVLGIVSERAADGLAPGTPAARRGQGGGDGDEDEYELDVDSLDPATLWELKRYTDAVVKEIEAKQAPTGRETLPPTGEGAKEAAGAAAQGAAEAGSAPQAAPGGNLGGAPAGAEPQNAAAQDAAIQDAAAPAPGLAAAPAPASAPVSALSPSPAPTLSPLPAPSPDGAALPPADAPSTSPRPAVSEGVGSKQEGGEPFPPAPGAGAAPRGPGDLTTFVSATGPGAGAPPSLRPQGARPDVTLRNEGAWASLSADGRGGAAAVAADGQAGQTGDVDDDDVDGLWSEFQGRSDR